MSLRGVLWLFLRKDVEHRDLESGVNGLGPADSSKLILAVYTKHYINWTAR
jgi:hypothetical protein